METRNTIKTLDADLRRIKYNAFTLAPILMSFYKECQIAKDNVLLAYLVFPILYSEKWKNSNNIRINRNSRLEVWVLNDKMPLMGLNDRISFFSKYTTIVLQYCFDQEWAIVDENNNFVVKKKDLKEETTSDMKLARNLNHLIQNMTVSQIYSTLGIGKLCIHE